MRARYEFWFVACGGFCFCGCDLVLRSFSWSVFAGEDLSMWWLLCVCVCCAVHIVRWCWTPCGSLGSNTTGKTTARFSSCMVFYFNLKITQGVCGLRNLIFAGFTNEIIFFYYFPWCWLFWNLFEEMFSSPHKLCYCTNRGMVKTIWKRLQQKPKLKKIRTTNQNSYLALI